MSDYTIKPLSHNDLEAMFVIMEEETKSWEGKFGLISKGYENFIGYFTQINFDNANVFVLRHNDTIVGFAHINVMNTLAFTLDLEKDCMFNLPIIRKEHRLMAKELMNKMISRAEHLGIGEIQCFGGLQWDTDIKILYEFEQAHQISILISNYDNIDVKSTPYRELLVGEIREFADFMFNDVYPEMYKEHYTLKDHIDDISEDFSSSADSIKYWVSKDVKFQNAFKYYIEDENKEIGNCVPLVGRSDNFTGKSIKTLLEVISHSKIMNIKTINIINNFFDTEVFSQLKNRGISVKDLCIYKKK